jgi:hypothetical protein
VLDLSECQRLKLIPLGVGKIQGLKTLILPKDLSEMEIPPVVTFPFFFFSFLFKLLPNAGG